MKSPKKTKIDWCDSSLNPVVGCANNCPYCYARRMNGRRLPWSIKDFNKPEFFPARLNALYAKSPKSIFMDSMSDIAFWRQDWKQRIFTAIRENPQHDYIFLTKVPTAYNESYRPDEKNIFLGASLTGRETYAKIPDIISFLSIEPLLAPVTLPKLTNLKQIIIGVQTGGGADRVIPQREWIDSLVAEADTRGIRVFMKESSDNTLRNIMGEDFRQDPLIWIKGGVRP